MKTLDDLLGEGVSGRRVLLRADLNVPFDKKDATKITDDGRIRAVLPTIVALRDAGAGIAERLQRGQAGPDPAVVGDRVRVLVQRDVQVGAYQHAPTRNAIAEQFVDGLHRLEPTSATRSTSRLE